MQDLRVEPLDVERLAEAYPLIRSATRVSQQRWEEFGRELICGGGGVLAVTAPDGCIHGVAAFRPSPSLRHQQSLDVEVIVAFELSGDDRVREQLCSTLEQVAATHRCRTVNFTMLPRSYGEPLSPARAALERLGMRLETLNFVRDLQPPDERSQTRK
jgi:hypothetical protein